MFENGAMVNYVACEVCFKQKVISRKACCKKSQVKARSDEVTNSRVYKIKFKNSNNSVEVLNVTKQYIDSEYSSNILDDKSSLSLIKYTHKADNIHTYEWSNFQKVEEFGNYIIYSNQFPIIEFIYRWGDDLQSIPRIQSFVTDHKIAPKESCYESKSRPISIIARPLLLISQRSFWTGLMESYFKFVHSSCILFSLVNFDQNTAPKSLLSAIYFAGFVIQPNPPEEIRAYMYTYAVTNIKKILLSVKISSAQALGLYSYALYLDGSSSLSRVCLSHFARMNHALGIGINRKSLPIIDQYNRKLINNNMRLYYMWAKLGPSSYNIASDDEEEGEEGDLDMYKPEYQFPNSSLNLCNNDFEGTLYSVFFCQFAKINNFTVNIISKLCKYDLKEIKVEIEGLKSETNEVYNDVKLTLESVINLVSEYKNQMSIYLELIKAPYIACILSIYSKMLEISKRGRYSIAQAILDKGIELWDLISSNRVFIDMWSWGPYIVGFHLIQAYPYCSKTQKKSVKFILKSIIHLFYKEGYDFKNIYFLILKTQFNLINSD